MLYDVIVTTNNHTEGHQYETHVLITQATEKGFTADQAQNFIIPAQIIDEFIINHFLSDQGRPNHRNMITECMDNEGRFFDIEMIPSNKVGHTTEIRTHTLVQAFDSFIDSKIKLSIDAVNALNAISNIWAELEIGGTYHETRMTAVHVYVPQYDNRGIPSGPYIYEFPDKFMLVLGNMIYEDKHIESLERKLYDWYRSERIHDQDTELEDKAEYMCYWGEGYHTDEDGYSVEKHFSTYFTQAQGYDEQTITKVRALEVAETVNLSDPSGEHIVTRIR